MLAISAEFDPEVPAATGDSADPVVEGKKSEKDSVKVEKESVGAECMSVNEGPSVKVMFEATVLKCDCVVESMVMAEWSCV